MLGLDMRDTSQKVSDQLLSDDTDLSSPTGMRDFAKAISQYAPVQAMGLLQAADERDREIKAEELNKEQIETTIERNRESIKNLKSQRKEVERRLESIPGVVEELKVSGEDFLAGAVDSGAMTPAEAYNQLNKKSNTSDELWVRLSNSKIFNRVTGELKDFGEDEEIAHTLQVGEGERATLYAIGQDGNQLWSVSAADLLAAQQAGDGVNVTPPDGSTPPPTSSFANKLKEQLDSLSPTLTTIAKAKSLVNRYSAGIVPRVISATTGATTSSTGATPEPGIITGVGTALLQSRVDLEETIKQIRANIAFSELQAMRTDPENKTGGALGNVSNIELDLLSSSLATLSADLDDELLLQNLESVERHYQNFLNIEAGIPVQIDLENPVYQGRFKETATGEIATFVDGEWMIIEGESKLEFKKF